MNIPKRIEFKINKHRNFGLKIKVFKHYKMKTFTFWRFMLVLNFRTIEQEVEDFNNPNFFKEHKKGEA